MSDTPRTEPLDHYVNDGAFDPDRAVELTPQQEKYYRASQWQLMWWKLKRHRLATASGIILLAIYVSLLVSEFINPYNPNFRNTDYLYMPPQEVHLFHEGDFVGPFVYGVIVERDMKNWQWVYKENKADVQKIRFFCTGNDTPAQNTNSGA